MRENPININIIILLIKISQSSCKTLLLFAKMTNIYHQVNYNYFLFLFLIIIFFRYPFIFYYHSNSFLSSHPLPLFYFFLFFFTPSCPSNLTTPYVPASCYVSFFLLCFYSCSSLYSSSFFLYLP